jgi:hypothetical protein
MTRAVNIRLALRWIMRWALHLFGRLKLPLHGYASA